MLRSGTTLAHFKESSPADENLSSNLEAVLRRPEVASEFFFPAERAIWRAGRYHLVKSDLGPTKSATGGVRFHASNPSGRGPLTDAEVRQDVGRLVEAVQMIRREPGLNNAVLSGDIVKGNQLGNRAGRRVKFGLNIPEGDRFDDETSAARETHKRIVGAMKRSGFVVEEPAERFDPETGLDGLRLWANQLRLRKRRSPILLILAAFLIAALLAMLPWNCQKSDPLLSTLVPTNSLIIILDQSGSMSTVFPTVRTQGKQFLNGRLSGYWKKYYIDVIKYDAKAKSALRDLKEVDPSTIDEVGRFLDEAPSGGGTNLASALQTAAEEVSRHKKPTTLVILTDGQDQSIPAILGDLPTWKARFDGVEVHVNTVSPRLLTPGADSRPVDAFEKGLADLSAGLGGRFGLGTGGTP